MNYHNALDCGVSTICKTVPCIIWQALVPHDPLRPTILQAIVELVLLAAIIGLAILAIKRYHNQR
jgi:hypothetical protein